MFRTRYWLFIVVMCFAGPSVTAQNTASLTDSQIAHIVYTAGQVDIAAANLALRTRLTLPSEPLPAPPLGITRPRTGRPCRHLPI